MNFKKWVCKCALRISILFVKKRYFGHFLAFSFIVTGKTSKVPKINFSVEKIKFLRTLYFLQLSKIHNIGYTGSL